MKCKICPVETHFEFEGIVLNKYKVKYYRCPSCDFIQTEDPYWLEEAYTSPISSLDIGLINRNIKFSKFTSTLISLLFKRDSIFLDYGGGFGMFTRMMRDRGYNFYRQDIYCQNIFAFGFDLDDFNDRPKFELITAFEVFEHLVDPIKEIEQMLNYSDNILFSTELHGKEHLNFNNYWYFLPDSGQHVALYSVESLKFIAKKLGLFLYSNQTSLHLLSKRKINKILFKIGSTGRTISILDYLIVKPDSLLLKDFEKIRAQK